MRYPCFFLLLIGMIFLSTECARDFDFFNKLPPPKKPPKISSITTAESSDQQFPLTHFPEPFLKRFIDQNLLAILGIAALLFLLFIDLRLHNMKKRKRRAIPLDETDVALLGLAARTLGTLMRRIEAKIKPKIIPFPRGR